MDKDQVIEDLAHAVLLLVQQTTQQEVQEMALGQDILDAIAQESTAVDSIIALLRGLVPNVVPQATANQIIGAINADRARIEEAVLANTPPPPPSS